MVDKLMSDMKQLHAKYGHRWSSKGQACMTLEEGFGKTGGGIMQSDFVLFLDLQPRILAKHIFGVGNALGLSTLTLAIMLPAQDPGGLAAPSIVARTVS